MDNGLKDAKWYKRGSWCTFGGSAFLTRGRHRGCEARDTSAFWQLFPRDVIGAQANVPEPRKSMVWRAKTDQIDVTTGRIWPDHEWSKRSRHKREYVLNEFWQIFVVDRLDHRDAINIHANVQF